MRVIGVFIVLTLLGTGFPLKRNSDVEYRRIRSTVVEFEDKNLEEAIREKIEKPEGGLTPADLQKIAELNLSGKEITNLARIENLTNLRRLDISNNNIADIIPLKPLLESGKLQELNVLGNLLTVKDLRFLTIWAGHNPDNLLLVMKLQENGFNLEEITLKMAVIISSTQTEHSG
jgi:hypothetical protein